MNDTFRSQFRLPHELADKLRSAAEASGRSLNGEVVARLQDSFDAPPDIADVSSFLKELAFQRDLFQRHSQSLQFTQRMLAACLQAALQRLTEEEQGEGLFVASAKLAQGILENDGKSLLEGVTVLFPELKNLPVIGELESVVDKEKRGDDITPDIRRSIERDRAKWEDNQRKKARGSSE